MYKITMMNIGIRKNKMKVDSKRCDGVLDGLTVQNADSGISCITKLDQMQLHKSRNMVQVKISINILYIGVYVLIHKVYLLCNGMFMQ